MDYVMNYKTITKVKFIYLDNKDVFNRNWYGYNIIDSYIDFDGLLKLISDIEEGTSIGRTKLRTLHKEAFTGTTLFGNSITFNTYVIWTTDSTILRYSFDEALIPLNKEILRRQRDRKIDYLLGSSL